MHASATTTCRARGASRRFAVRNEASWRARGKHFGVRASEDESFVPYRRPSWVEVPEGFVEPEQHLSYEEEMELFGDEYVPQEAPYGSPAIFLVGFQVHEWPHVRMYVDRLGGHDVKVVPVAQETLHVRTEDVLAMPEPDWSRPPTKNGANGAPAGAKRVAVFAGLVQEDIATITELLEGSGLPRMVVAVVSKEEKNHPLGQVVAEAMVQERKHTANWDAWKELQQDLPKVLTEEELKEIEGAESMEKREEGALDPRNEIQRGWEQATATWAKYPKKGSKTEEMVNAYFEGDMERGNRLLMEIEAQKLGDGSQANEQDQQEDGTDAPGKVEVVNFEDLGYRLAQEERQSAETAAMAASEQPAMQKADVSVQDDWGTAVDPSKTRKSQTLTKAELLEICKRTGLDYEEELQKAAERGLHLT